MILEKYERRSVLSTLWIFLTVNYIYCDVFTLHHAPTLKLFLTGVVGDIELTQQFLLAFAFVMELPMLMIVLSKFLNYAPNRIINIIVAPILAVIQLGSLTQGYTLHYLFFSFIEISTALIILYIAVQWKREE